MSVSTITCPECAFEVIYASLGAKGSYRTTNDFLATCLHGAEVDTRDAMKCPVLRAEAERVLNLRLPPRASEP